MQHYIARRLIQAVFSLFVLSVVVFLLLRIAPGADPALLRCGLSCTPEKLEALREEMGLKDNYLVQYGTWARQLVTGSLGSDWNGGPVATELQRRLPVTAELLVITVLATVAIGVPFGIISAVYRNSPADYSARFTAILGLAVPSFWLATLVLIIPQTLWNYAPPLTENIGFFDDPWDNLRQYVPPAIVLGAVSAAGIMRLTRSSMLEVLRQDYIRTARSKGLRERIIIGRHAMKNSLIPVVTVLGLQVAALFGGAVIIENIFNLPGLGNYELGALLRKDFQVAQTLTLYIGVIVVLLNLVVDILYGSLDPRIRYA